MELRHQEKSMMDFFQIGEIVRREAELNLACSDIGKLTLGLIQFYLAADIQLIAQDGGAWIAVRVLPYAVLVDHQSAVLR
ncbi:hypothetical protein PMM47T1_03544 [Pseudomonas sp. M47T1]|nr:hypothetical protein PMM47T1_03544 [Pseudomonas sp. M47T1]